MKAGIAGGIDVIVKTINTHIDNLDVCKNGCGALKNILLNGKTTFLLRKKEKNIFFRGQQKNSKDIRRGKCCPGCRGKAPRLINNHQ